MRSLENPLKMISSKRPRAEYLERVNVPTMPPAYALLPESDSYLVDLLSLRRRAVESARYYVPSN